MANVRGTIGFVVCLFVVTASSSLKGAAAVPLDQLLEQLLKEASENRKAGRYKSAEDCVNRGIERLRALEFGHKSSIFFFLERTRIYVAQSRIREAQADCDAAVALWPNSAANQKNSAQALFLKTLVLDSWADVRAALHQREAAEAGYEATIKTIEGVPGMEKPFADSLNKLARFYLDWADSISEQGSTVDQEKRRDLLKKAVDPLEKAISIRQAIHDDIELLDSWHNKAILYSMQRSWQNAFDRSDALVRQVDAHRGQVPLDIQYNAYYRRAVIRWESAIDKAKIADTALADLAIAEDIAERERLLGAETPYQRSVFAVCMSSVYERMMGWQAVVGTISESFRAMENARGKGLAEELTFYSSKVKGDLKQALTPELDKWSKARTQLDAALKQRQPAAILAPLRNALADAESAVLSKYRCFHAARELTATPAEQGNDWSSLQKWAGNEQALVLEYSVGPHVGYGLAMWNDGERKLQRLAFELKVGPEEADLLRVTSGALSAAKLKEILRGDGDEGKKKGILDWLMQTIPKDPELRQTRTEFLPRALHALCRILVPQQAQQELRAGRLKRILVIPDGLLSLVPFEALVLDVGEKDEFDCRYLIDFDAPVTYAPSARVFFWLGRPRNPVNPLATIPVLTVAKKDFDDHTKYRRLSPAVVDESDAFARISPDPNRVKQLKAKNETTKAAVRESLPTARIIHLATHGQAGRDDEYIFGHLVLSKDADNDDGLLKLAEIYTTELKACELTVLSACETNLGPAVPAEAPWALSRAFLVAGSRRIVASNWLVDDDATSKVMQRFAGKIAAQMKQAGADYATVDYARLLHEAKLEVRREMGTKTVCFWAPLIHIGP